MSFVPAHIFKFIIIGNSAVGKSCLLLRFDEGRFQPIHDVTVGVTFSIKMVKIEDQDVKVQIWDTAGQEIFRSITRQYYRDSHCAIVVYDITEQNSFASISTWIADVKSLAPAECVIALVGNKSDLESQRQVTVEDGQRFASENNLIFFETSALAGTNVEELFQAAVDKVFQKHKVTVTSQQPAPLVPSDPKQKGKCCS